LQIGKYPLIELCLNSSKHVNMKKICKTTLLSALMISVSFSAFAQERTFSNPTMVWKNKRAGSDGMDLIISGAARRDPSLLFPYLSCFASKGDRFIISDAGIVTSDIIVTSGASSGCRGNVPSEMAR
jgi:hypothetical protein